MAQLVEASSHNQKVAGSIPCQGTTWVADSIPGLSVCGRQLSVLLSGIDVSLSPFLLSSLPKK